MAERPNPHYEDTNDPHYPPKAVLNKNVRRAAVWVYVGPLIALLAIVGIALLYWLGRPPGRTEGDGLNPATGTTGEQRPATEREGQPQQGGGDPSPQPDSTRDEIEFRGGSER
ncbi:MAG: hypothetical protein AB7P99_12780 [Vicinamibacterales bacterium]